MLDINYRYYLPKDNGKRVVLSTWSIRKCECGRFLGLHQHYCKKCSLKKRRETYRKSDFKKRHGVSE